MSDETSPVPLQLLVELRFDGCDCQPELMVVDVPDVQGGEPRRRALIVHEERCHWLWLRSSRWN